MTRLTIRHETHYRYEKPVGFGPHRLLVRPRDSHATRIVRASLSFSPAGQTRWLYDALGNCVCMLMPEGQSRELSIISELVIERFPASLSALRIENPRTAMPIVYDRCDRLVLDPFIDPATDDPDGALLDWVRDQVARPDETALDLVLRLNASIRAQFAYTERPEGDARSPAHTIAMGSGACRDLAWLMVESLRRLGYAARFVTGYLYSPALSDIRGAGATHAWCEVFLPDLGWTEFDPTNGLAESSALIPVAVSRTPEEASPIGGSILGDPGLASLTVRVDVRPADPVKAAA
ncbi:transglutaminase family protein [Phenylobacterium sp.]|uniref:transglutaminase family protein n=1 Tax=Phenylobacterium sp. TaxID=1871053 RepID=UPI00286B424B|nr:transglutaminase family protein [Phenylobacterium sp.]